MQMQVIRHPRTRRFAQVQPHVQPIRPVNFPQNPLRPLRQRHQLTGSLRWQSRQTGLMHIRHHHQMPGVVRKSIQHQEASLSSFQNVSRCVGLFPRHPVSDGVLGRCQHVAENAVQILRPRCQRLRNAPLGPSFVLSGNVGVAPRCPKPIHARSTCLSSNPCSKYRGAIFLRLFCPSAASYKYGIFPSAIRPLNCDNTVTIVRSSVRFIDRVMSDCYTLN